MENSNSFNYIPLEDNSFSFERASNKEEALLYLAFLKDGLPIFEMDFHVEGMKYDSVLLAGFISAVSTWSKEMSDKGLEKIDQGSLKVGFLEGKNISFFYLASAISLELESKLHILLRHFENKYDFLLETEFICDTSLFDEFKPSVLKILSEPTIKKHYIPVLTFTKSGIVKKYPKSESIVNLINGKTTVAELKILTDLNIPEISEILSTLRLDGYIDFEVTVKETDIFSLTLLGYKKLFCEKSSRLSFSELTCSCDNLFDCLKLIDGSKSVSEISKAYNMDLSEVQNVFTLLLKEDLISHVPDSYKSVIVLDTMVNSLYKKLETLTNYEFAQDFIEHNFKEYDSLLSNLVRPSEKGFDFNLLKDFIKQSDEFSSSELYESFMDPLLTIFDTISDLSEDDDEDLRVSIFEEISKRYGVIF